MNSESMCCICNQWVNDYQQYCPYCQTESPTWKIGKLEPKKKSSLLCPKCSFENDLGNQVCVVCDSNMFQEKESKKKCQICGLDIYEKLFNQHSTNCLLSYEEVEKYKQEVKNIKEIEEYDKTLEKCKYCHLNFPKQLMEDHFLCCEKKQKLQKKPFQLKRGRKPIGPRPGLKPIQPIIKVDPIINDAPLIQLKFNESELLIPQEVKRLTTLQKNAILHMQQQSNKKHNKSLPAVQKKANKLGFKKQDLQNLQFYIENHAPIIVHIHILKHMQFFIKDTHYRNQFETGKSSGSLSRDSRTQWQNRMFDKKYSEAKDFQRVKYGVINLTNDPKGVNCAVGYGLSYLLLKQHVRNRCTMTDMDSSNSSSQIGTVKYCFHILEKLHDKQLISVFNAAKALQQSSSVTTTYKQVQVHGPIQFSKDIERIYVNKLQVKEKSFLDMVYQFSEQFGVQIQFF